MRKSVLIVSALAAIAFGTPAIADEVMIKGEVTKIDAEQGKLTIKHDPIKKFDMDAMTMIFKAGDPTMTTAVKAGDKVQFHVDKVNGQFTVTKLEKAK